MAHMVRILATLILAVVLFAGGFVAATHFTADTEAETTWQYEVLNDAAEYTVFLAELPSTCVVDFEMFEFVTVGDLLFLVSWACPD